MNIIPKILILDIETAPNIAYVWRFYKENVGAKQVLEHSTILSFACKWLGGGDVIYYQDTRNQSEAELLKELINVLDIADIVIAHNGSKFDLPTIQGRAMVAGLHPPSPYKVVDTLRAAQYEFNMPANSLEYLALVLEVAPKDNHHKFPGFLLWQECLKNNPEAWEEMEKYNKQDVETLEQVYMKMRPWMKRHPNLAVMLEDDRPLCPKCGSQHIQLRGFTTTQTYKYQKFVCMNCGGWSRTRFNLFPKEKKHALLVNAG